MPGSRSRRLPARATSPPISAQSRSVRPTANQRRVGRSATAPPSWRSPRIRAIFAYRRDSSRSPPSTEARRNPCFFHLVDGGQGQRQCIICGTYLEKRGGVPQEHAPEIPVRFYRKGTGKEPVLEWLRGASTKKTDE